MLLETMYVQYTAVMILSAVACAPSVAYPLLLLASLPPLEVP
jgi:hypothetical protein